MGIEVLKPGALSLLQDRGRYGWQRFGVVVSGAMDEWSYRCANALLGNEAGEAALEITLMGPSLLFTKPQVVALCGANLSARIGNRMLPLNRTLIVNAGTRIDFGERITGVRAYLAVRGGFAVPVVMGSRSTYLRAAIGGLDGRALRKGDILPVTDAGTPTPDELAMLGTQDFVKRHDRPGLVAPVCAPRKSLRVIVGQQWELFTTPAKSAFVNKKFLISPQSDRMGIRLTGPVLERRYAFEMISEGVTFGTIQVPPDGQPIVLMADRQTTGGYPKIACVVSVDLPLLAQLAPGDSIRFEVVPIQQAQALYITREYALEELAETVRARST